MFMLVLITQQRREFLTQPTQTHGLPKPIGLWVGLGELRISWVGLGAEKSPQKNFALLGLGGSWAPFREARGFWAGLGWEFHEY